MMKAVYNKDYYKNFCFLWHHFLRRTIVQLNKEQRIKDKSENLLPNFSPDQNSSKRASVPMAIGRHKRRCHKEP